MHGGCARDDESSHNRLRSKTKRKLRLEHAEAAFYIGLPLGHISIAAATRTKLARVPSQRSPGDQFEH
jgi:hypothetical protein